MKATLSITALLLSLGHTAFAGETSIDGKALHSKNCVGCHVNMTGGDGSALYTRDNRRVSSYKGLGAQVRLCESNLGLTWFDDEVMSVVNHLNNTYYHFDKN